MGGKLPPETVDTKTNRCSQMMEMSAGANSQGIESLDAGVFTYTELDPVTNGFYQQIISKKMLS